MTKSISFLPCDNSSSLPIRHVMDTLDVIASGGCLFSGETGTPFPGGMISRVDGTISASGSEEDAETSPETPATP
ncbi:MAG: hypothetical protein ACYCRD_07070 [Leptospirillum sp.]